VAQDDDDIDALRELLLFIENDGDLYRQRAQPIMKNLAKKMVKGTYDSDRAVTAWKYLADAGAKKYQKEFGTEDSPIFTPAVRKAVAIELADAFESEAKANPDYIEKLAKGASERRRAREGVFYSVAHQGSGGGFHSDGTFETLAEAKEEAEYRCAMGHFAEVTKYDGDKRETIWECGRML